MPQRSLAGPPTYRLDTLGRLTLSGGRTTPASHQRRRLALLAMLAVAGDRGVSRDRLIACFWPEGDSVTGRHSLDQLLHAIRRGLDDSIFDGVDPLRLAAAVVSSDVADFEGAFANRDFGRAVEVYRGPFLDGFYVDGAPQYERWVEVERARLAGRYIEALDHLAQVAEEAGDWTSVVSWRRRIADAEPLSSRFALGLMRALAASGDQGAAVQHAQLHARLLRSELDSAADPSVTAFADRLRQGRVDHLPFAGAERPDPSVQGDTSTGGAGRADAAPIADAVISPSASGGVDDASLAPRSRLATAKSLMSRRALLAVGGVALVGAAYLARPSGAAADPNSIVVVPFTITGGDSTQRYLREGVVDLLSVMLTGQGGPVAVDSWTAINAWNGVAGPRDATAALARLTARRVGAAEALFGTVIIAPDRLTLAASTISATDGVVHPLTAVSGSPGDVQALLDRLLAQVLVRTAGVREPTVASLTSQSLPALRAYLDGRAAYRRARLTEAVAALSRAIDLDSTFALAALDLAVATTKLLRQPICLNGVCRMTSVMPGFRDAAPEADDQRFDRAIHLASAYETKLIPRDRPLLAALRGPDPPQAAPARKLLEGLLKAAEAAPDRAEIQYLLGMLMLYQGPAIGVSDALGRAGALFTLASQLDTSYLAPLARLVDVAAFAGDTTGLRRAADRYLARDSVGATADYVRWRAAITLGNDRVLGALRSRFDALDPSTLRQIRTASQLSATGLDDGDRAARVLIDRGTDPVARGQDLYFGAMLALNRGHPHRADSLLRLRRELDSTANNFWQSATQFALFGDGDTASAEAVTRERAGWLARDTLPAARQRPAPDRVLTAALWDRRRGRSADWQAEARWVRSHPLGALSDVADMVLATDARRSDAAALRAHVDSVSLDGCCSFPHYIDLALGLAYDSAGNDVAAMRAFHRGRWRTPTTFLSTFLREEGRAAERAGDRASAIQAYEAYLALRADPEPSLRADRDSVRATVARLRSAR